MLSPPWVYLGAPITAVHSHLLDLFNFGLCNGLDVLPEALSL